MLDLVEQATVVVEAECETDGVTIKVVFSPDVLVNWSGSKAKQAPNLALSASSNAFSACAWDLLGSRAWAQISNATDITPEEGEALKSQTHTYNCLLHGTQQQFLYRKQNLMVCMLLKV